MKNLLLGAILLFSMISFGQTIINTKPFPKEITQQFLFIAGDSIKIVKSENYNKIYNPEYTIINKKDSTNISLVELKYDVTDKLKKCIDFKTKNKTIVFDSWPFSIFRANSNNLNFITFRYVDSLKNVRYNYYMTVEKAENLYSEILNITNDD